jgi:hypothetical protein
MPFYIVCSKANCTKNSLQACEALIFGRVLVKVKYPTATKINQYVENHPEKWGKKMRGAACSLTQERPPVQVQT